MVNSQDQQQVLKVFDLIYTESLLWESTKAFTKQSQSHTLHYFAMTRKIQKNEFKIEVVQNMPGKGQRSRYSTNEAL